MAKSEQEIIQTIDEYVKKCGGVYPQWYIGITNDPERRMFEEHNVSRQGHWVYEPAASSTVARRIEKLFIDVRKMTGGLGGGDTDANVVYSYKKSAGTKP